MQQILDLHIHSKYSRACSRDLTLPNIEAACRIKGVDIIATGDFTYPAWFADIKNELDPSASSGQESGLYRLKTAKDNKVKFILSTEFALIYKDGGRVRRIHLVVHAPNISAVEELNAHLGKRFNIRSDGRPILGISAPDLIKICLSIHPRFLIYPAHIWTPWFSVFGSKSGFNSMEECFHEYVENIHAYETGLSSDPEMNWRVSPLDKLTLISNSDAHSPQNIGREANVFELENITYDEIYEAIKNSSIRAATNGAHANDNRGSKLKYTIEFYPEEGMYHYDGHRDCGVSFSPPETKKQKGICPVCRRPLIIGVMNRVEELADRPAGFTPVAAPGFRKLVGLDKIIAEVLGVKSRGSKKVMTEYNKIIGHFGNELNVLLAINPDEIKKVLPAAIAEGIKRVREGRINIKPGFDGQYGEIKIFSEAEKNKNKQVTLF